MTESRNGIRLPLSPARKLVAELLHHAKRIPSIPLKMQFNVGRLATARATCFNKPSWVAIFLKAYAIVARDRPDLRRCYVPYPRPHLYEHPINSCAVLLERDWDGEKAVLAAKLRSPDQQSLADIDAALRHFQTAPLGQVSDLRQLVRLANLPGFIRRFIFWSTINLSGTKRCKRFGTFMVSTLGNLGVEQVHPIAPVTTYLSFGPVADNGDVTALLVYDHRVLDGRAVARALCNLDVALNGPICDEVETLAARLVAAA